MPCCASSFAFCVLRHAVLCFALLCFALLRHLLCRWAVYSSKRLNTLVEKVYLMSCTPVPDLAVLLFSTAFDATLPPLPGAAAATPDAQDSATTDSPGDTATTAAGAAEPTAAGAADPTAAVDTQPAPAAAEPAAAAKTAAGLTVEHISHEAAIGGVRYEWTGTNLVRVSESEEDQEGEEEQESSAETPGSDEASVRGSVQLLGGFAGYNFAEPDDLAALLWMRQHLQLLLELAVSA